MMKFLRRFKCICVLCLAACLLVFTGCGTDKKNGDASNVLDLSDEELTNAFHEAMDAYALISTGSAEFNPNGSVDADGWTEMTGEVHPVTDSRFPSLQAMREYLEAHFTKEYAANILERSPYEEIDGQLVVMGEGSGDVRDWKKGVLKSYDKETGVAVFVVRMPDGAEDYEAVFTKTDDGCRIKSVTDIRGSVL